MTWAWTAVGSFTAGRRAASCLFGRSAGAGAGAAVGFPLAACSSSSREHCWSTSSTGKQDISQKPRRSVSVVVLGPCKNSVPSTSPSNCMNRSRISRRAWPDTERTSLSDSASRPPATATASQRGGRPVLADAPSQRPAGGKSRRQLRTSAVLARCRNRDWYLVSSWHLQSIAISKINHTIITGHLSKNISQKLSFNCCFRCLQIFFFAVNCEMPIDKQCSRLGITISSVY